MQRDQRSKVYERDHCGEKGTEKEGEADRGREWKTWEKRAD